MGREVWKREQEGARVPGGWHGLPAVTGGRGQGCGGCGGDTGSAQFGSADLEGQAEGLSEMTAAQEADLAC